MKARAYIPGEEWPWKNTKSPPWSRLAAWKKWLKPISYSVAEEAKLAMCPPYSEETLLAFTTIAIAFQRIYERMRCSSAALPGKRGWRWGGMVLI